MKPQNRAHLIMWHTRRPVVTRRNAIEQLEPPARSARTRPQALRRGLLADFARVHTTAMHAYDKMILQEVEYFLELLAMLRRVRCQREYVSRWAESASLTKGT